MATGGGRRLHGVALISVLGALMLTLLLEALDQTVVGTALPKIIADLSGFDKYVWVVTAYLLASTTMIPIVGKLSDQFGRKWFFLTGVVVFLLGSILSGAAQTMNELIAFRAVQGLGSGIGISLVFTVVGDIFPPAERAKWQGIFGAVYGFSSVVGPTIGGWLTDHGPLLGSFVTDATRWRWVFYVNLPIGILAFAAIVIYLPRDISVRSSRLTGWAAIRRIDFLGAALASAATICLLLGLTWGGNQVYDWGSPQVIGVLFASGVLYVAFAIVERTAAEPILPLDLFRNQVFSADAVLALTTGMVLLSVVIELPLYLQGVLGESATNSGAVITPLTVSLVIGSTAAGLVIAKVQRYHAAVIVGAVLVCTGTFLLSRLSPTTSIFTAGWQMVLTGVGLGVFFPVLTLAVQNALPRTRMGVGTGSVTYIRALGQVLGLAVVQSVVNNTLTTQIAQPGALPAQAKLIPPSALKQLTNPDLLVNTSAQKQAIAQAIAAQTAGKHLSASAVAQIAQQTTDLLNAIFAALKGALALGIAHGLFFVFLFSLGILAGALFLKDVPLATQFRDEHPHAAQAEQTTAAGAPVDSPAPIM